MKEFVFTVRETLTGPAYIAAETEADARIKLKEQYEADEIIVDNVSDVEFILDRVSDLDRPREMTFTRFNILGVPALLTEMRWNEITGVTGLGKLHHYDLRHGDDDSVPLTVERHVVANRYATIFTAKPLLPGGMMVREIGIGEWGYDSDRDDCTAEEFLAEEGIE